MRYEDGSGKSSGCGFGLQPGVEGRQCVALAESCDGEVWGSGRATEADVREVIGIFCREHDAGEAIPAAVLHKAGDLIGWRDFSAKKLEAAGDIADGEVVVDVGQAVGKIFRDEGAIGGCVVGVEGVEPGLQQGGELRVGKLRVCQGAIAKAARGRRMEGAASNAETAMNLRRFISVLGL